MRINKKKLIIYSIVACFTVTCIGGYIYYNSDNSGLDISSFKTPLNDDNSKNVLNKKTITEDSKKHGEQDIKRLRADKNENDIAVIIKSKYNNVWKDGATIKWRQDLGLFEFINGLTVLYVTPDGKNLIQGHVFDINTGLDYTDQTLARVSKININDLQIKDAVKMVNGDGKTVIYVFAYLDDAFKSYYKNVLENYNNATIYIFLNQATYSKSDDPYMSAYKTKVFKEIQCSNDRSRELSNFLHTNKLVAVTEIVDNCNEYIKNYNADALFKKMQISWSPTIFTNNGNRYKPLPDYQLKIVAEKDMVAVESSSNIKTTSVSSKPVSSSPNKLPIAQQMGSGSNN